MDTNSLDAPSRLADALLALLKADKELNERGWENQPTLVLLEDKKEMAKKELLKVIKEVCND